MTWCLGLLVLAAWHASAQLHGAPVDGLYFAAVLFWFLAGLGALTVALVRLVSSKLGAGVAGSPPKARPAAPAHREGE